MRRVQRGVEEPIGAPSVRLRTQQGEVGGFEKFDDIGRIGGGERYTDTHPDHDLMAVEIEGLADGVNDPLAQRFCFGRLGHAALKDGKFIAAQPRDAVIFSSAQAQPCTDLLQELVADGMPEGIVHILEAIEIEAQQGELLARGPAA